MIRNYLAEALRDEDEAIARIEADKAIAEIQENVDNLLDNLFSN